MSTESGTTSSKGSFGTWTSPITAEILSSQAISLQEVVATTSSKIYAIEARPAENGRYCIVEYSVEGSRDVLPKEYSARTRVHEYGGGALAAKPDGSLIFADWATKGVYSLDPTTKLAIPVIDADSQVYYANFHVHPTKVNWVLAIREDHSSQAVENTLVAIDVTSKTFKTVARGADFYSHPQFDSAGESVCWTQWNHPDMPWTGTELYVASWLDGKLSNASLVAGKPGVESVSQPRWGLDGTLFFASDRSGYWQLHRLDKGSAEAKMISLEGLKTGEFAGPEWLLGSCTYASLTPNILIAAWTKDASETLVVIDLETSSYTFAPYPLVDIRFNAIARVTSTSFAIIGSMLTSPTALCYFDLADPFKSTVLKSSLELSIPVKFYSEAEHITFPCVYGPNPSDSSHALFLPPKNPEYEPPPTALPPLVIDMHGGPTSHVGRGLSLSWQYWTSRGFALAAPNYAGSSGYGREYRNKLNGKWGISDVADAASCVAHLAATNRIDATRVGIVGGSAGGYAALQALCVYPSLWASGVSLYGISDVKALVRDTHKFESRYADRLLFGDENPSNEQKEKVFKERSPVFQADSIRAAVLLLQGSKDEVVPPDQAEGMAKVIQEHGGKAKVVVFEGEGHGFRRAENVKRAIVEQERWWVEGLVRE
ncbi:hypothetical protein MMC30_009055 [Trapelia coarctata]|nr:hypothetical protein [Trapelia coarctata]